MCHKHWLHFLKKIAGVEKLLQKCQIVIFIENLQKFLRYTGKHCVKVQISIDTENKIMQSRELDGKKCHENDLAEVYCGCKNKLNKQKQEYGVCMFCKVS